jgi:MFS family permease
MVYPTLIAAVSDASQPRDRARVVAVYRFWRDFGFVLGALIAGLGADATSPKTAIVVVAALTAASGLLVAGTSWHTRPGGGRALAIERTKGDTKWLTARS